MIDYEFWKRIAIVCNKFKWYHQVIGWYHMKLVSEQEIIDGVEYLEKLKID